MSTVIESRDIQPTSGASPVSLNIYRGDIVAVMGDSGSGKSLLLRCWMGLAPFAGGKSQIIGTAIYADHGDYPKRATPQTICRKHGGTKNPTLMAEALTAVGLWDQRLTPYSELTPSQQTACKLLICLMSSDDAVFVDGLIDYMSLWHQSSVLDMVAKRAHQGQTWVISTHQPSIAQACTHLMLLRAGSIHFFGTLTDFLGEVTPSVIDVQTTAVPSVRDLIEPFTIDVEERAHGLRFKARKGQQIAAKLLVHGYGDIRTITVRQPSLEELLKNWK